MTVIFYYHNGAKKILHPKMHAAQQVSVRALMQQLCHDFGAASFKIKT